MNFVDRIILTKEKDQGRNLKDSIQLLCESLKDIENITKCELLRFPQKYKGTKYIFSTWNMPTFTHEEVIRLFPSLEAIYYAAGATEYFAAPFLDNGIRIHSAIMENSIPVAEFVTSQIILGNKGYFQSQISYKKPFFCLSHRTAKKYTNSRPGNYEAKVGIIGCGNVGMKILELLKAYDLNIYVCDPALNQSDEEKLGVKICDLDLIFEECDVISSQLPDNCKTKGLINYELLSKMKETAVFINTGRGAQVIEGDLVRVMREKPLACALLDVVHKEPVRPWSRLIWTKNIFLSPHIAGSQSQEEIRLVSAMIKKYKKNKK